MDDSLFLNSLKLILDESNQYFIIMNEANYIQEGTIGEFLKKIDLKKIFSFIFNKFIEIIGTIWGKFKAMYNAFTKKTTLIKKYRKKLDNISWDVEYPDERSIYTNLDNSTNINLYNMSLNEEYNMFTGIINTISSVKRIEDLYTTILSIKNSMAPTDEFLDQKRGQAIGKNNYISKEDFASEAYLYFKKESKIPAGIIRPDEVRNITKEYFDSKKIEDAITKDKKSLDDAAKINLNKINSTNLTNINGSFSNNINNEVYNIFGDIIKNYCNRTQGLCNIYLQLFGIKLDIFKQYKEEQTKILSKVILISMKEGKM